jgi:hypothetical protein
MTGLEDRQALARGIQEARKNGARLRQACAVVGISVRTLQRWQTPDGDIRPDGRPGAVRPVPAHALTEEERARLLAVANEPRFADVPPARIVPMLADEGVYLASESTFSRVLRKQGQSAHRGRAKPPQAVRPPTTHVATGARQVWCWDMTYLPVQVAGQWFFLHLILDLPCSAMPSIGRSFPPGALPILSRRAPGRRVSCIGPTTRTAIAASAMSLRHSATPAKITRSSPLAMRCTFGPGSKTRLAGRVRLATGIQSAQSRSTQNATPSSRRIWPAKMLRSWQHDSGDNYLDMRREMDLPSQRQRQLVWASRFAIIIPTRERASALFRTTSAHGSAQKRGIRLAEPKSCLAKNR